MNEKFPSLMMAGVTLAASVVLSSCAEQPASYKDIVLSDGHRALLFETGKVCADDMLRGLVFTEKSTNPTASGRRFVAARGSETVDVTSLPENKGSTILLTRNVGDSTTSIAFESSVAAPNLAVAGLLSSIDAGQTKVASWRNSEGSTAGVKRVGSKTYLIVPVAFNPTPNNVIQNIADMCQTEQN